jgi:hypothetical protein
MRTQRRINMVKKEDGKSGKPKKREIDELEENLFSDVEPKHPSKEHGGPEVGLLEKPKHAPKEKSLSIAPHTVERVIYISIICLLVIFFFFNPFYKYYPWSSCSATEDVVAGDDVGVEEKEDEDETTDDDEEGDTATEEEEDETTDDDEEDDADEEEEGDEPEVEVKADLSGEVKVQITGTKTQKKEWGGKVTEVSFILDNEAEEFIPKLKVAIVDEDTGVYRQSPKIRVYDTLSPGKRIIGTIDTTKFSFQDITTPKTIIFKVYDEGDEPNYAKDKFITEVEQEVMIN